MKNRSFLPAAEALIAVFFIFPVLLRLAWGRIVAPRSLPVLLLLLTLSATSGCSVALKPQPLTSPGQTYSDQIAVSRRAEGIDGKVGWGRATVFYIPLVPVYIDGDGNEKVMEQIRGALEQVGYKVTVTDDSAAPSSLPILRAKVDKFYFNNYTWFFPVVPTWGEVRLTLTLFSQNGKPLWSRAFSGDGSTFNFTDGYSIAANESMRKITESMMREFAGEEFHRTLSQR